MRTEISKIGLSFIVSILILSTVAFAQGLQDLISTFKEVGVFQFYLPFILVFAILYALLLKTSIFGVKENPNKPLVTIIALAASAFIIVYTPVGITFSAFLTNFFGNAVVVILTIVVLILFANLLKEGQILDVTGLFKGNWLILGLVLLLLVVFGVFIASGGSSIFPGIKISAKPIFETIGGLSATTVAIIVLIIGTAIIVFIFAKPEKAPGAQPQPSR